MGAELSLDLVPVGTATLGLMGEAARGFAPLLSPGLFEALHYESEQS